MPIKDNPFAKKVKGLNKNKSIKFGPRITPISGYNRGIEGGRKWVKTDRKGYNFKNRSLEDGRSKNSLVVKQIIVIICQNIEYI